jgi:hypothetical protein
MMLSRCHVRRLHKALHLILEKYFRKRAPRQRGIEGVPGRVPDGSRPRLVIFQKMKDVRLDGVIPVEGSESLHPMEGSSMKASLNIVRTLWAWPGRTLPSPSGGAEVRAASWKAMLPPDPERMVSRGILEGV